MKINDALEILRELVSSHGDEYDEEALRVIKFMVLTQQTNNKQSTPCCFACGSHDVSYSIHCVDCGADNIG